MNIILGRWPNGRSSISVGPKKDDTMKALSKIGNIDSAELHLLHTFMMDFSFNDKGEQFLNQSGDYLIDEVISGAYPGLEHVSFKDTERYDDFVKEEFKRRLKTGKLIRTAARTYPSRSQRSSQIYLCRWPDGSLAITVGQNLETAIIDLDEFGNADNAEFHLLKFFLADFCYRDGAVLNLTRIDDSTWSQIIEKAYPSLSQVSLDGSEIAKEALEKEFKRDLRVGTRPLAIDPIARQLQEEMDAPAALATELCRRESCD
jgi:hypothetical protein